MQRLRNRYLLLLDVAMLALAPLLAYAVRLESWNLGPVQTHTALSIAVCSIVITVSALSGTGSYRRLWRYASVGELKGLAIASAISGLGLLIAGLFVLPALHLTPERVPLSVAVMSILFSVGAIVVPRLSIRVITTPPASRRRGDAGRRVLIAGAGVAGEMIVRELCGNRDLGLAAVGFVDDDSAKLGHRLSGLPILGTLDDIPHIVRAQRIDEILIAMPRAPGSVVQKVVRLAYEAGVRTKTVPALFEILADRVSVSALREVRIEDLLRREPIQTDLAAVTSLAAGRTVLVTGAGGSIGSELCRQLYSLNPDTLVLLGHGENLIFDMLNELRSKRPVGNRTRVVPVIADIRDRRRIHQVFDRHRPDVVFHAAAHKHVPLMEENVIEAVTNNVLGTKNIVDAAVAAGTEHLVLISTDKAVRPTSVMGASKRIAEHIVHNAALLHGRNFVAVRFGNVLGSMGSVVPMFLKQIREGGPVTVTHPEMRRYFMTIPEAVQLVLQAGALGRGGELYMLDMGEPVRIIDLARDMIRLSGLEEGTDIEIQFTGMRPGEKMYEEMFFSHEVAEPTAHPKILRSKNGQRDSCEPALISRFIELTTNGADDADIRAALQSIVCDFTNEGARSIPAAVSTETEHENPARRVTSMRTAANPRAGSARAATPAVHAPLP